MTAGGSVWAVIVAAGSGSRFGGHKQFATLGGREVAEWSITAAARCCDGTVLVVPRGASPGCAPMVSRVVSGGPTRPASVRAGLGAVPVQARFVVVHDAARPLASDQVWRAVISAVREGADAAVPCLPVTDTIKQLQPDGRLLTLQRSLLFAAQTPQAFLAESLRAAHAGGGEATDDASLVEALGGTVVQVPGDATNFKLTTGWDLLVAEALVSGGELKPGKLAERSGGVLGGDQ